MNTILESLKMARSLKRQFIVVLNDVIYGTDVNFCTLSQIKTISDIPRPFGGYITNILPPEKVDKFASEHSVDFLSNYSEVVDGVYFDQISFDDNFHRVLDISNTLNSYISNHNPAYIDDALNANKNFIDGAMSKVSDGLTNYVFSDNDFKYVSQSFNSVHAINKSDKVSVKIYNYDCISWLYLFTIKKKGYEIEEFIRYRKPNIYS